MNLGRRDVLKQSLVWGVAAASGRRGWAAGSDDQTFDEPRPLPHAASFQSQWLRSGPWVPVFDERHAANLKVVHGTIPRSLRGVFLRNGPNPLYEPVGGYTFPFDGDGMIHAVEFADGKASYRNRLIRTPWVEAEMTAQRPLYGGIAAVMHRPDSKSLPPGAPTTGGKNAANTHVVAHAGTILALYEAGLPYQLDLDLNTLGPYDFNGRLQGAMTAHPKIDPETGELLFFRYAPIRPYLVFFIADARGVITHHRPIDLPRPVMIHDFTCTPNYVIVPDCPAVFSIAAALLGKPILQWMPAFPARLGVIPRRSDHPAEPIWFEFDPFFCYHLLNAYETCDPQTNQVVSITVDLVKRSGFEIDGDPEKVKDDPGLLTRYELDLVHKTARVHLLDDRDVEFPRLNDRRAGRKNRFGYVAATGQAQTAAAFDSLVQHDFERNVTLVQTFGGNQWCGEGVFLPDPEGQGGEQEGWIITYTHDPAANQSFVALIDARDFAGPPAALIALPRRVPAGFHGSWVPLPL
jgi:carotenoid cleavage dioxygenase